MTADMFALRLLLATFAGWVNRDQARIIDYLCSTGSRGKTTARSSTG